MFEISCCCVPPWVPLETNPRPLDQSYIDLRSPLSLSLSLIALQQTRVSVSESIFTLDCFSSSSDWARLTWSAKTGPFSQHLAEDLLTSCSIFLFEVCNITDTGSLLGLLQLRFWIFFCLISSVEKLTYEHCQTKPLFSQKLANKQFYYQKKKSQVHFWSFHLTAESHANCSPVTNSKHLTFKSITKCVICNTKCSYTSYFPHNYKNICKNIYI